MIHLSVPIMFSYIDEWLISLVLVILLVIASRYVLNKSKSEEAPPKFPPSPPSLPIIGNYHQLGKLPHQSLHKLSKKYGQVVLLHLGSILTIVISSPELAKQILKTHDLDFCSRPESQGPRKMTYNLLDVAFAPYNDEWKERRKIGEKYSLQILNSKRSNSLLKSKRVEVVKKLIESLSLEASQKKTINLDQKMFHFLGEITTCVAFGKCYTEYQFKGGSQELKGILGEMSNNLPSFSAEDYLPSILGRIIDTISRQRRKLHNCYAKIDAYFETTLREHLHQHERTKGEVDEDYVDVLIRLSKEPKFPFSEQHIKAMFMDIFLGGIDTSANTIVWAMTELIRYPKVMQKLQNEIQSSIGRKEKLTEEDITNLKYLKMVVKETFRLHPGAPLLVPHETIRYCKIEDANCKLDIPPKTRILINAWAMGRDPTIWENPNEFYPERFEDSEIDFKGTNFELIPFGAGRRICPGLAMAINSIEYILTNLLYFFEWELPDGVKIEDVSMEEIVGITIHKKIPLYLNPIKYIYVGSKS